MAQAFVQSANAGAASSSVTSLTVTLGSNSTVNNLLIAAVMHSSATATLSAPTNWVQLATVGNNRTLSVFAYYGNPGGIGSVAFTASVSGGMAAHVAEFSGVAITSALDMFATNFNAGSTAMDSGTTATTANASELWFAALGYGASTNKTISSITNGFTADLITDASSSGGTGVHLSDYYKIASSTGTANVGATLSGSSNWQGIIVTLLPQTSTPITLSNAGTGSDAVSVGTITPATSETATGTDATSLGTIHPGLSDTATGSDPASVAITSTIADSGAGSDSASASVTSSIADTGAGSDSAAITNPIGLTDAGAGGAAVFLAARPPITQPFSMPGVPSGGPYVTASGANFVQNGQVLPRLYGATFYYNVQGGSASVFQSASNIARPIIDGTISTFVANRLTLLRPTDQWGGNAALTWDNPAIWTNMDYLVQQAYLNNLYVQMDLSGYKAVLAAQGLNQIDANNWIPFLQAVGAHYANVSNILFYTISGEPTFPRSANDVTNLVNFFTTASATLKAADPNHLVSPGGFINMNNGVANWWQSIWQISSIDVCCYKSYSLNDLNNVATYSAYGSSTLGKPTVQHEFGMPQMIGDGVWSGQTFNNIATSRASYYDTIYKSGEANGTSAFIFWNYNQGSGDSVLSTPDVPAIADTAAGSESVAVNNQASINISDPAKQSDVMTALTNDYDVDPIGSPATWAIILQHAWSVPNYPDQATGSDSANVGSVSFNLADVGTQADSESYVTLINDQATAADVEATGVTLPGQSDTAAGSEAMSFGTIAPAASDTATGSDTAGIVNTITPGVADSASGSDAEATGVTLPGQADSATGSDVEATGVTLPAQTDSATGSDASALGTIQPGLADTAAGSDGTTLASIAPAAADSATGSDAASLGTITPGLADTAAGTESIAATINPALSDTAAGQETETISATIPLSDTAAGVDALINAISFGISDSASGSDSAAVVIGIAIPDNATAADIAALRVYLSLTDQARGSDVIALAFRYRPPAIAGAAGSTNTIVATQDNGDIWP